MVMRKTLTMVTLGFALLGGAVLATAQTPAAGGANKTTRIMSIPELKTRAADAMKSMNRMLTDSFALLEQSIASQDIATTNARNEAITQMKALVKLSEQNHMTLQQRAAEGDRDAVEHEYVKINIASAKTQELYAQVKSAGGVRTDLEMTDVERTLDINAALPQPESIDFMPEGDTVPEPPIYASPYF